jgi:hypothetical protein
MSGNRLDVTVTYDAERGYIASAPELRQPVVALSLGGLRRRIEVALLPDDVRVVLQLDGLAERERHRRRAQALLAVAVLALALLHDPASAQARSGGVMPFVNQGGCPSGYYTSGSFCAPLNKDSRPAVPKPPGASCPSGWYQSGAACVRLNR